MFEIILGVIFLVIGIVAALNNVIKPSLERIVARMDTIISLLEKK